MLVLAVSAHLFGARENKRSGYIVSPHILGLSSRHSWHMFSIGWGDSGQFWRSTMAKMLTMKSQIKLGKRRRGSTIVEMAVVVPVFFLLIFGMIEFGRMLMVRQALTNAAREGCRKAVLATTQDVSVVSSTIRNYLQSAIPNSGNAGTCRVTISPADLNGIESGTQITTSIEVNYSDVSWMPAMFLGNAVLKGKSAMGRE
jgi:hypothetical protein